MCDTHGITTTVRKLYWAHCKTPSISEADLTLSAATDLVKSMRGTVPVTATQKQQHTTVLKKLLTILYNSEPSRVDDVGQTMVSPAASTSTNTTSPGVIASTRFVHERQTRIALHCQSFGRKKKRWRPRQPTTVSSMASPTTPPKSGEIMSKA